MQHGDVFAEHYRIVRELGRGGMGVVYQALDENLGRDVALKVMALSARHDPSAAGRFRREAQVLAALHHPGVVTVHDYGESDGQLFLVMRLVNGIDLARRLSDSRRLTPAHTVALAEQVAAALDALHENRLVHRDVKPSNILLEGDEQHPVLCDFGLAKPVDGSLSLTTAGTTVGTVQYMAPEQLGGDRGTPASDVYAFGCVLYHCLTGQPPFPGTDPYEIAAAHRGHPVPGARSLQPDLPVGVPPVLVRCLAKSPQERWATAGAAARALRAATATPPAPPSRAAQGPLETPVFASPAPLPRPRPEPVPPRRVAISRVRLPRLLVGLVVVVVAGAVGVLLSTPPDVEDTRPAAAPSASAAGLDEADRRLAAMLREEYGGCTPLPRLPGQLARLNCDRTPEGVASVHAVQWADARAVDTGFDSAYVGKPRYPDAPCSDFRGGSGAAGTGHVSTRIDGGRIACYVNVNDDAVLAWQYDDRAISLLAIRDDNDSSSLFTWWQANRDQVLR